MSLLTFTVTSYTFYYQYISYFWPGSGSPYTVAVHFILTSKCACLSSPEVFTQCDVPSSENVWLIN